MATKPTYILDTNVLISDPKAIFTFRNCELILPYKVIEELEKHKKSPGEIGMAARDCSRILADLIENCKNQEDLHDGITLKEQKSLLRVIQLDHDTVRQEFETLHSGDDFILATCVMLQKKYSAQKLDTSNLILVSNDILLKIRANSFGIKTAAYDKNHEIKNLSDLYSGYKVIQLDDDLITQFHVEKESKFHHFDVEVEKITNEKVLPNEFLVFSDNLKQKPYPIVRLDKNGKLKFVTEKKITELKAMNAEQVMAAELLFDQDVHLVTLTGPSGTGKTLLSIAAGLDQVLDKTTPYEKILIIRPMHAVGKEIGFLKGSKEEKLEPWIAPIKDNLKFLLSGNEKKSQKNFKNFGNHLETKNIEYLFEEGIIEIEALTYVRGRSLNNCFIIIDESQNLNHHEIKAILTRAGHKSKIVLTGDIEQTDRMDVDSISNGLSVAVEKFKEYGLHGHVTLTQGLRSELATLASKIL